MSISIYSYEHLIHVPLISGAQAPPSQIICELLAELLAPLSNSLIGEHYASLCHKQFDISVAEGESEVEPKTVADDFGWKAVTAIKIRLRGHWQSIILLPPYCNSPLTRQYHKKKLEVAGSGRSWNVERADLYAYVSRSSQLVTKNK